MNSDILEQFSDGALIEKHCNTNDNKALSLLYRKYSKEVYSRCLALVKNADDANDLVHDIFVKVFTRLHDLKDKNSFNSWLKKITYNTCFDYLRLRQKRKENPMEDDQEFDEDESDKEEQALQEIKLEQMEILFPKLSEDDRAILLMYYRDDLSIKEMQQLLKIGASAVKMRLKRARSRLARLYNELNTISNE